MLVVFEPTTVVFVTVVVFPLVVVVVVVVVVEPTLGGRVVVEVVTWGFALGRGLGVGRG